MNGAFHHYAERSLRLDPPIVTRDARRRTAPNFHVLRVANRPCVVHERLIETAPTLKIKMPTLAGEHFHTPCSTRVMFMGESDSDGNATAKTCL